MQERKEKRASKKMERIVEAATDLFTRFGVRRVTVEEVCRKAGASKMTFYKYFSNKMELVKRIWDGWLEEGYRKLYEIDAMPIPFYEKMQRIIEYKMGMLGRFDPDFVDELINVSPDMREFFEDLKSKNLTLFMRFVAKAQERGEMRVMRPEFFLAVFDILRELLENSELRKAYANDIEFFREVHNFFFFGILPVEGRERLA